MTERGDSRSSGRGATNQVWINPNPSSSDSDSLAVTLATLEPDEILVFGRLDGAPVDELARFHELDDLIGARLERSGAGSVVDTEAGGSGATWVVDVGGK